MNKFLIKYLPIILILLLTACSYKPIFSERNYDFGIDQIKYSGENDINAIIKNKLNLIKKNPDKDKKKYNLSINSLREKLIVSKDSKGDPLKFELIIETNFEIYHSGKLLLDKKIEKNNIYNNDSDKFKLEQNERIIVENLSEKVSEVIISSIINLNDN